MESAEDSTAESEEPTDEASTDEYDKSADECDESGYGFGCSMDEFSNRDRIGRKYMGEKLAAMQRTGHIAEYYTMEHWKALRPSRRIANLIRSGQKPPSFPQTETCSQLDHDPSQCGCTTCHWCRQKNPELKVECSFCKAHWCRRCLQNRFAECLDECLAAADVWGCPTCRKICDCSAVGCQRARRGWVRTPLARCS